MYLDVNENTRVIGCTDTRILITNVPNISLENYDLKDDVAIYDYTKQIMYPMINIGKATKFVMWDKPASENINDYIDKKYRK